MQSAAQQTRGEPHLLIIGDPGTGKSQLLKWAARCSPRSVLTTGVGSTQAGLTVAAVKDGSEWGLEAGAMVLADGGVCCIDEFGSIREADRISLHEAMEQQSISVAKAGIVCTLRTRASVFAVMNPKTGIYQSDADLSVNTAIASPLLSRFDLILLLLDKQDSDWDSDITNFIMSRLPDGNEHRPVKRQRLANRMVWSLNDVQQYIQLIRRRFEPKFTASAELVIRSYYQKARSANANRGSIRVTVRMLESLVRLATAHARLMFRQRVLIRDAIMAIILIECSCLNSALICEPSRVMHIVFDDDPDDAYLQSMRASLLDQLGVADSIMLTDDDYDYEAEIAVERQRSMKFEEGRRSSTVPLANISPDRPRNVKQSHIQPAAESDPSRDSQSIQAPQAPPQHPPSIDDDFWDDSMLEAIKQQIASQPELPFSMPDRPVTVDRLAPPVVAEPPVVNSHDAMDFSQPAAPPVLQEVIQEPASSSPKVEEVDESFVDDFSAFD